MYISSPNKWLGKYDPYWYSRLIGLKATYIAVVVFIANIFIQPPIAPLIMLLAVAGVLVIERPNINSFKTKDIIYLAFLILVTLTVSLFATYVSFNLVFILLISGWAFILYSLLKKQPSLFALASTVLMLGIMSLEAVNTGNFFIIMKEIGYIWMFGVIVFWAHKLFPNYYHKVWHCALSRSFETWLIMLRLRDKEMSKLGFKHYLAQVSVAPLLRSKQLFSMIRITKLIGEYNYYLTMLISKDSTSLDELDMIYNDLHNLSAAIDDGVEIVYHPNEYINIKLGYHDNFIKQIASSWNRICIPVNN